ncbi:MAG: hypothetical protein ABIT09_07410 [Croceibacterium sp.]
MASEPGLVPGHPTPADAPLSGTRSQAMQRLQVGVFGLAAMILLVGLANIFITSARHNDARSSTQGAPSVAAESDTASATDPLADAGVVPDMPGKSAPATSANAPPPAGR